MAFSYAVLQTCPFVDQKPITAVSRWEWVACSLATLNATTPPLAPPWLVALNFILRTVPRHWYRASLPLASSASHCGLGCLPPACAAGLRAAGCGGGAAAVGR